MNYNYVKQFVIECIDSDYFEDYELSDLYKKGIRDSFQKDFPDYYIHEQGYKNWEVESIGFTCSLDATYEQIKKEFEKFISSNVRSSDELKIKNALINSAKELYYTGNGTFKTYFSYGLNRYDSLIRVLLYVCNDEISNDRGRALKIMEDHNIDSGTIGFKDTFDELGGVDIIAQKNGIIKIKGLSSEELDRLDYVYDLIK